MVPPFGGIAGGRGGEGGVNWERARRAAVVPALVLWSIVTFAALLIAIAGAVTGDFVSVLIGVVLLLVLLFIAGWVIAGDDQ